MNPLLSTTRILSSLSTLLIPRLAYATTIDVSNWYGNLTWAQIIGSVVTTLQNSGVIICGVTFFIGAVYYAAAPGDNEKQNAKSLMIGSLIGVAIIAGAMGILNAVIYFLYG